MATNRVHKTRLCSSQQSHQLTLVRGQKVLGEVMTSRKACLTLLPRRFHRLGVLEVPHLRSAFSSL